MSFAKPRHTQTAPPAPETTPEEFFHAAVQCAGEAEQAVIVQERYYAVGGLTIRLIFAGPALIPYVTPALEHLEIPPQGEASLTVHVWDTETTGANMPRAPWSINYDVAFRGDVTGFNDGRYRTAYQPQAALLSMLDMETGTALYWTRDARLIPSYIVAVPLLYILNWWLRKHGLQIIHAAALCAPEGGVLLAGKGGSGKSNTALTCLNAGFAYAGDDYSLVSPGPEPTVHSLYNSGKTFAADIDHLPFLAPLITNPELLGEEKALYFLHRHFPEKLATCFPLKALLLPRVTGKPETVIRRATSAAAILALAPSTIAQLAGAGLEAHASIRDLVAAVPCYHLELGTEREKIPGVIRDLLNGQPDISST
jgi:hypothetical protein